MIVDPHLAGVRAVVNTLDQRDIRVPGDLWDGIVATLTRNGLPTDGLPPVGELFVVVDREQLVASLNYREPS